MCTIEAYIRAQSPRPAGYAASDVVEKKIKKSISRSRVLWPLSARIKGTTIGAVRVFVRRRQQAFKVHFYVYYFFFLHIYILHRDTVLRTRTARIQNSIRGVHHHLRWLVRKCEKNKNIKISCARKTSPRVPDHDDRSVILLSAQISIFPENINGRATSPLEMRVFQERPIPPRGLPHLYFPFFIFIPETRRVWHLLVIDEFAAGSLENGIRTSVARLISILMRFLYTTSFIAQLRCAEI